MERKVAIKHLYISIILDNNDFNQLLEKIANQFEAVATFDLETIYVAGTSLTVLKLSQLNELLVLIAKLSKKYSIKEYSFELKIEKAMLPKLRLLKQYQVNRLSFKIVSFNDQILEQIGYLYNQTDIIEAYNNAIELGFNNINFDMNYNFPGQTKNQFIDDYRMIKKLKPVHICWYEMENSAKIKAESLGEKRNIDFYFIVNKLMHKLKYYRYELTSFVKKKKYCLHSLAWWTNQLYYAIGIEADGFIYKSNNYYLTNSGKDINSSIITEALLSEKDYYLQILMMGLHLEQGICFNIIIDGKKAYLFYQNQINTLISKGLLILTYTSLKLSKKGKDFFSQILLVLLDK